MNDEIVKEETELDIEFYKLNIKRSQLELKKLEQPSKEAHYYA
jgi:hypothetical protein